MGKEYYGYFNSKYISKSERENGLRTKAYEDIYKDISNMSEEYKKYVCVNNEIKKRVQELQEEEFIKNKGKIIDSKIPKFIDKYVCSSIEKCNRLSASWTLEQARLSKFEEIISKIRNKRPDWEIGDDFDEVDLMQTLIDIQKK